MHKTFTGGGGSATKGFFIALFLLFNSLLPAFSRAQDSPEFSQSTEKTSFFRLEDASQIDTILGLFLAAYGSAEAMQGRKVVIVVGEGNHNEEIVPDRFRVLAEDLRRELEAQGLKVTVLYTPSKEELEQALQDADGMVYIGHGTKDGKLHIRQGRSGPAWALDPTLLARLLHGRRLRLLVLIACRAVNEDTRKLWQRSARLVAGYDDSDSHVLAILWHWQRFVQGFPVRGLPRLWGTGAEITLPIIRQILLQDMSPEELYELLITLSETNHKLPPDTHLLHATGGVQ